MITEYLQTEMEHSGVLNSDLYIVRNQGYFALYLVADLTELRVFFDC